MQSQFVKIEKRTSRVKPFSVADWPIVILRKKRSFVSITTHSTHYAVYIYVAFIDDTVYTCLPQSLYTLSNHAEA